MDQTAPPKRNLVTETEALIGGLIEALAILLEPGIFRPRKSLTYIANAVLLPAEAALRRLVHLIAGSLAPLPASQAALLPRSAGEVPRRGGGGSPGDTPQPRAPLFRLTEPLPRPEPDARTIGTSTTLPPVTRTPRAPADPSVYEANLQRRFAALQAAFADPVRTARRLQRLTARLAPAAPVLSLDQIPGLASDIITEENRDTLQRLNLAVTRQRAERLNTS